MDSKWKLEERLREIKNLYACMRHSVMFEDDKQWDHQPELWEVAEYLVSKINEVVPKGYRWHFNQYMSQLQYYKTVDTGNGSDEFVNMPLEWLPYLEKKNSKLHDLVCDVIAKIYHIVQCNMMITGTFESHVVDMAEDELLNSGDDEDELRIRASDYAKYQQGGVVMKYWNRFRTSRISIERLTEQVVSYRANTPLQRSIKRWLLTAIPVFENPVDLDRYCPKMETDDGEPITVYESVKFIWSWHDTVGTSAEEWINDHYGNFGYIDPCLLGTFTTKKHIKPAPVESLKNIFKFFRAGRSMYWRHYKDRITTFYDRRRLTEPL